jgi:DamX protein
MIFNRPLNSLAEARESMRNLPDYPTKSDAFIKGGAQVLEEVAKSTQGSNTP